MVIGQPNAHNGGLAIRPKGRLLMEQSPLREQPKEVSMDDNALVRYSLDDGLAAIVLDRPQASNALN